MRYPIATPANPGDNGFALVYDSGAEPDPATQSTRVAQKRYHRIQLSFRGSTNITNCVHEWQPPGSTSWFSVTGNGTFATVAGVQIFRDVTFVAGRNRIYFQNGATAPTTWFLSAELQDQAT